MKYNFQNINERSALDIAQSILKTCYWGNTSLTPQIILEKINDKAFAKAIFSSVIYNSPYVCEHFKIFKLEYIQEFIREYRERKITGIKAEFLKKRLTILSSLYEA